DRGRGGVSASLALGHGNALHAVYARLPAHRAERARSNDLEDHFLDTAKCGFGERDDLDAPAARLTVARVHAPKLRGKQRSFVTAGTGADFNDGRPVVERIGR